ncbi:hypothetical protein [Flavobacterium lindanitolerans]|uniref:hypothetical protein n=1 Tax=Flavobacterium lindanitolerans TaxID=428988 RepID=UPI0031E2A3DC
MENVAMDKDKFLLKDKLAVIEKSFTKDGWITISLRDYKDDDDSSTIYCCIVHDDKIEEYRNNRNWIISPGSEGSPSIFGGIGKDAESYYQKYAEEGIEPFLFDKDFIFADGRDEYMDVCEDFVNYFKLYEKGLNKQNRKYYFIDDLGELVEVLDIKPGIVKLKLKFLKEYISIRKVHFAICFDFMRLSKINFSDLDITPIDDDFKTEKSFYNHFIRSLDFDAGKKQSWIHGKTIISFDPNKKKSYHFDDEEEKYESFLVGYDDDGNEKLLDCSRTNDKYFIVTYFRKEVLNKYYNEPAKYKVDGWRVSSSFISLKIDNNNDDYVAVFLVELSTLPHKEQLHWKQYNIPPQKGISATYYKTMIEGSWVEKPETPDLLFKHQYEKFNKDWEKKFGWKFYKDLASEDQHIFTSLHIPTNNNVKAFSEQVLSIIKLTIDRLNEAEIQKDLVLEKNDRGITKVEKFLKSNDVDIPDMIVFLRNLYDLRSGLLAHTFSNSNKACKKAIEYFGITKDNYTDVARDIFIKSIYTLNTLRGIFLKTDEDDLELLTDKEQ